MKKTTTPEHISTYRYQSWQIEIVIAGGILYGLFTSSETLRQFFYEVYPITEITTNSIILLFGSFIVTNVLLIGFTANLLLRAVWLAYLGLGFWFPNDINYEKVRGSKEYKDALKAEKTASQRLLTLEKWCNLSFSFAVLIGFLVISLFVSLSVVIWILDSISSDVGIANNSVFIYSLAFVLLVVQLGVLDIFLWRKRKEGSSSNKLKRGVVWFFKILTLSFITRREFLVLRTNTRRWILNSFIVLYVVIAVIASAGSIGKFYRNEAAFEYNFFDDRNYYNIPGSARVSPTSYSDNLRETSKSLIGNIQSKIIRDNVVELFIVSWDDYDNYLEERFELYGVATEVAEFENDQAYFDFYEHNAKFWQQSMNDLFKVKIDNIYYTKLQWKRYIHPKTKEEGYLTFIDITDLPKKEHLLQVWFKNKFNNGYVRDRFWMRIPFWKE